MDENVEKGFIGKISWILKELAIHLGLDTLLKEAVSHQTKALTASYFESLNFDDEAAFARAKDEVYKKMAKAGGEALAAQAMADFEAWLATKERWRANCYRLIVVTHDELDQQVAVLDGMFTARNNAERDAVIMNLLRDKPLMMKLGEKLTINYVLAWRWIRAKFGNAYNWAQTELWPVLRALPGQIDDWLGTTGVEAIRPTCVMAKKGLRDARKLVRRHNGI